MTTSEGTAEAGRELRQLKLPVLRMSPQAVSWLQVSPLAVVLVVLFALPTVLFLVVSFFDYDRTGIYPAFIFDNYRDLLTTPATIRVYVSSLRFAVIVWAITLVLGFFLAHFLIFHVRSGVTRAVLFVLCAIPFLTSGIIRTIAWIPFLGRNGAFNQILIKLNVIAHPLDFLLFSDFAVIVWAITLFLGFNIAWFLIFHVRNAAIRTVLFLLCAIPFWTSGIIRTIAWIPFLGRNGAFNTILQDLHITSQPLTFLLFSDFAVVVTYVHLFTLLMVGPIANSLAKIDPALLEAARDAGASRWRIMVDVVIPLSKTGIALGSILVFTQVMGDYFVVKQMSGGQSASIVSMLSTEIQAMQYPAASANAMVLVVFVAIMVACMMRVVDVRKELVK